MGRMLIFGIVAQLVVARYKSVPAIVVRATIATLLGTGDLASDIYTMFSLFRLGHLSPAYALLTMVLLNFAVGQVRAHVPMCRCAASRGPRRRRVETNMRRGSSCLCSCFWLFA